MSAINDNNYYSVSGWMISKLGLKGIALNVYAIIYGFTQDGETEFTGSINYLCEFCGGVSRPTIIKALKELTEKGYIIRHEEKINNVSYVRYKACPEVVKNLYGGSKNSLLGVVKNLYGGSKEILQGGSKESLPNNIPSDNYDDIKIDIDGKPQKKQPKTFRPPTVDEVKAYCHERSNNVDAERFVDYYTANGWKVGKNPMKDWKAAVRTWEKQGWNGYGYGGEKKQKSKDRFENGSFDADDFDKLVNNWG